MRIIIYSLIILLATAFLAENDVNADTHHKTSIPAITNTPLLAADLSNDLIAITTRFTGAEVLLFGSTNGVGDIIVVVRAPSRALAGSRLLALRRGSRDPARSRLLVFVVLEKSWRDSMSLLSGG